MGPGEGGSGGWFTDGSSQGRWHLVRRSWGKSILDRGTRKRQSLRLGQKKGLCSWRGASLGQVTGPEARWGPPDWDRGPPDRDLGQILLGLEDCWEPDRKCFKQEHDSAKDGCRCCVENVLDEKAGLGDQEGWPVIPSTDTSGAITVPPLKTEPGTGEANGQCPCSPGARVLVGETDNTQV